MHTVCETTLPSTAKSSLASQEVGRDFFEESDQPKKNKGTGIGCSAAKQPDHTAMNPTGNKPNSYTPTF